MNDPTPRERLPLTPLSHAILLALADRDRHGYGILKQVEDASDGALRPGTGTLYAALQRLSDDGLVAPSERSPGEDEDQRRKYYRLTSPGRAVVRAETLRLQRLVEVARRKRVIGDAAAPAEGGG